MPQPFPLERVSAEQLIAQDTVDDVFEDRADPAPRRERDTFRARVGADPEDRPLSIRWSSPEPSPPGERGVSESSEVARPSRARHDDGNGWSIAGRPARLSVVVVDALVDAIVSGRYPPGTLLPPEPVLCQSFDVSRSVVREAMKVLEEKGLARARQGHGTTISPPDEWNMLDPAVLDAAIRADDTMQILDALVDVRVALESAMARTAAQSMSDADLAELGELLEQMSSQLHDPERYLATDTRYHDFIMRCSGNRLGRSVIRTIHPHARASSRYNPPADEESIRLAHVGHTAIYEQLHRRDPEGAAAAMQEHIRKTWTLRKPKGG